MPRDYNTPHGDFGSASGTALTKEERRAASGMSTQGKGSGDGPPAAPVDKYIRSGVNWILGKK